MSVPDLCYDYHMPVHCAADYLSHYLLFLNVYHCLGGLSLFRDFLRSEYSDENLEFWIACEEYRTLKDDRLVAQAQKIFADFVAIQAPREVRAFVNKCTVVPVLGWMQYDVIGPCYAATYIAPYITFACIYHKM